MLEGAGRSVTRLYSVAENRFCAARPPQRLKAGLEDKPLIAEVSRCARQRHRQNRISQQAVWPGLQVGKGAAVDAPPLSDYWPVPESLTFCGLPEALCVMVRAPGIVPDCAGVNVTSRVQVL
jgi:hypothetical protein